MSEQTLKRLEAESYEMPAGAGEVVRDLLSELEHLRYRMCQLKAKDERHNRNQREVLEAMDGSRRMKSSHRDRQGR